MPLSWGDEVIGWVNCTRAGGVLDVRAGYAAVRDRGAVFARAFDEEAARLGAFLGPAGQAVPAETPIVDQAGIP